MIIYYGVGKFSYSVSIDLHQRANPMTDPMTDNELSALIQDLQTHTPLQRVNIVEARAIFARLDELGYVVAKPAATNE